MLIDSHCHLDRIDLAPFNDDFNQFMDEVSVQEIEQLLCVSINWEAYPAMRELVKAYKNISISVGVHPNETEGYEPSVKDLIEMATKDNVVAIGETGLDYFRLEDNLKTQQERFITHITAAKQLKKPLIIHTREAKEDTLEIMRSESAGEASGVLHCFTEDWDMAKKALDMDFYISFSGIVTFKNADKVKEVAKKVPSDRFLIETDSPYLAPVPKRGKPNYPTYVKYVAEQVAELRGCSFSTIAQTSQENYYRLFGA